MVTAGSPMRAAVGKAGMRIVPSLARRWWHNPLFEADYYVATNPDLDLEGLTPEVHYRAKGAANGLDPNPMFGTRWYTERYPDVTRTGLNPLDHYFLYGASEGRDPSARFQTTWYLEKYPDVTASGMNPLLHWLHHGRLEGRKTREWAAKVPPVIPGPGQRRIITFFHDGHAEFQMFEHLALRALERGYDVGFQEDQWRAADIGFYCSHGAKPRNTRLSVVMLHDLGQDWWPDRQTFEENQWRITPWDAFDIAMVPGPIWVTAWQSVAQNAFARPRIGVFEVGWPKADRLHADPVSFARDVATLRKSLALSDAPVVLFAPAWDSIEKRDSFLTEAAGLPVNLVLKFDPLHRVEDDPKATELAPNVRLIDPKVNIMFCLALADLIVSDESNCLVEALFFDVPGIGVTDWNVPSIPELGYAERPAEPPSFVKEIQASALGATIMSMLQNLPAEKEKARLELARWVRNEEHSSELVLDILDAAVSSRAWPIEPLTAPAVSAAESDSN